MSLKNTSGVQYRSLDITNVMHRKCLHRIRSEDPLVVIDSFSMKEIKVCEMQFSH